MEVIEKEVGKMPIRSRSFSNSFAAIPEIAPRGALVKIVFAGAHLRKSSFPNINNNSSNSNNVIPWPLSACSSNKCEDDEEDEEGPCSSCSGLRSTTTTTTKTATTNIIGIDNITVKEPNANVMRLHQKRKLRRSMNSFGSNSNIVSGIDEKLTHNFELSGYIEMLGEDVETNSNFEVGDRVLIYPYSGQTKEYCEYLCVPDLRHLVKLPAEIPLDGAASIVSGALYAFNLAQDLRTQCKALEEQGISPKVLIVGSRPLVLWTLSLLSYVLATAAENEEEEELLPKTTMVVASQDESLLSLEKDFPQVKFVQWNKDAYDAVLVERTLEAFGSSSRGSCCNKADVLAVLDSTPKMFQRAMQCLRYAGQVFVLPETVSPRHFQLAAENNGFAIKVTESGTPQTYHDLLALARTREIYLPSWEQFTVKESRRISKLSETGLLSGNAVIKLFDTEVM